MESLKIILTNVTKKEFFPLRLKFKILLFEDSDNINPFTSDFFVKNERTRKNVSGRVYASLQSCFDSVYWKKKIFLKQSIYNLTHLITYFGTQITIIV